MIKIADLRKNVLFSNVKVSELRRILPKLQNVYYPRSAVICREGERGSCVYLILSGQVKLTVTEATHTKTLAYLNAGDFFGESAVLGNETRTVTAEVVIDAEILQLGQNHFDELVERDPTILHNIIRSLDLRIRMDTLGLFQPQAKPNEIVAIYSPRKVSLKTFTAVNVAVSLLHQTNLPVVILDMTLNDPVIADILKIGIPPVIGVEGITADTVQQVLRRHASGIHLVTIAPDLLRAGKISREEIAGTLSLLKTLFQYVVINTSTEISNNTFEALDLSDTVVLLSPLGEEAPVGMFDHQEIITAYYVPRGSSAITANVERVTPEMAPILLPIDEVAERRFYEQGEILAEVDTTTKTSQVIQKIARHVAGLQIGLALGGLAARGLSHIGVLKVLEEHQIPIDMIAGSNTGAVIGAAYALGMSADELEKTVLQWESHLPLLSVRDVNPFRGGFLSHHRIMKLIASVIPPDMTFQDLKIPLRIITMTLDTGQEVALSSGSLLKALEASIAIPGVFAPVKYGDQFLIDGAIINPVPISDLVEMHADILVGVNSFAPLTPSYPPPPKAYINLVGYAEKLKMIDIIIRSFQNLQYEISTAKSMIADITIMPEVLGYSWSHFDKAAGIIESGRKAAENMLPELKRIIESRRKFKKL
ncbi:MAG: cyclic nucleotide-binding domain-containing protein [Sedimentisphaerales bacterium]|nr:cyclic nucleotide-binding domain-containing protein [Sedimentisphaerales bacterium]